jgi:hypothetical protein
VKNRVEGLDGTIHWRTSVLLGIVDAHKIGRLVMILLMNAQPLDKVDGKGRFPKDGLVLRVICRDLPPPSETQHVAQR